MQTSDDPKNKKKKSQMQTDTAAASFEPRPKPADYDTAWYEESDGQYYNQYDWYEDENGEWQYDYRNVCIQASWIHFKKYKLETFFSI